MTTSLFNSVKRDKNELDAEFYGNKTLTSNYQNFRTNLRKDEIHNNLKLIPTDESLMYYDSQGIKQVFKPLVNDGIYRHITAYYPLQRLYMDTMYIRLHNSTLAFINIIDLFSKYAYSKMFVIGAKAQAVKSSQSVETLNGFIDSIKEYGYTQKDIGELTLDGGSEFLGDFSSYLNKEEILNTYANARDKLKTSPIERFNRTLRLYLEKYRAIHSQINNNVLQKIIKSYNGVSHANLHFSPVEILTSKKDQLEVEQHFLDLDNQNHIHALKIGQEVRILLNRTPFQKIKPIWSSEIYKISSVINGSNYQLTDKPGHFHLDELQPIQKPFLLNQDKVHIIDDDEQENNFIDNSTHPLPAEIIEPNRVQVRPQVSIPVQREPSSRIRNLPERFKN